MRWQKSCDTGDLKHLRKLSLWVYWYKCCDNKIDVTFSHADGVRAVVNEGNVDSRHVDWWTTQNDPEEAGRGKTTE